MALSGQNNVTLLVGWVEPLRNPPSSMRRGKRWVIRRGWARFLESKEGLSADVADYADKKENTKLVMLIRVSYDICGYIPRLHVSRRLRYRHFRAQTEFCPALKRYLSSLVTPPPDRPNSPRVASTYDAGRSAPYPQSRPFG